MSSQDVLLLFVGRPSFPRWMIVQKERYWCKGTWKKRRRNGELFASKSEAEEELVVARASSQAS